MLKPSKTMTEGPQRRESLNFLETLYHKYESYCCPSCTALPEILCYNQGKNTIKLNCKKDGEITMKLSEYIEKMKNFESTSELKMKNKCIEHKQKYICFCQDCKQNLCKSCIVDPKHEKHIKYDIESLRPDKKELLFIKNHIEMLLQKKNDLIRAIKSLDYEITFFDAIIYSYERQKDPNYLLNINLKHLIYGENLNIEEIKNTEFVYEQIKNESFDDFIKNNFLKATEGLNQINLVDKKLGNDISEQIFKGIENNILYNKMFKAGLIKKQSEFISFNAIKYLNLRGNNISSLNFLSGIKFPNLEIFSLNDNELDSIETLRYVTFPLLKELYLSKNKIENIDILDSLKTPKLKVLWLSNNKISSINVLKKVKFPQLLKLSLSKNNITDISVFAKKNVKFPQLYELYLNDNKFEFNKYSKIIEDLFLKVKQFYY